MTRAVRLGRVGFGLLAAAALVGWWWPLPPELAGLGRGGSWRILARGGELLREVGGEGASWVPLEDLPPALIQATLVAEDVRFPLHPGVDPLAVARALWLNLRRGRVLSGGSTLTQQLVRLTAPPHRSGWAGKLEEAWLALRLERRLGKREILEACLNLAPYGRGIRGAEAASRFYLGRPASQLSPAQAAWLAVLPRAPVDLDPWTAPAELRRFQRDLLGRMAWHGRLSPAALRLALDEEVTPVELPEPWSAPHFVDAVVAGLEELPELSSGAWDVRTTLDLELQRACEGLLRSQLARLEGQEVTQGAVVVLDVSSGELLALVGSRDHRDPREGQVNGALALRQPGSTLKPFAYALALEGGMSAATILADVDFIATRRERSLPRNYDWTDHGPVRLRTALACSYNIAAVRVLDQIGVGALLARLRDLGLTSLDGPPGRYGLGLALGVGEVSLLDLTVAYRALARGGRWGPPRSLLELVPRHGGGEGVPGPALPPERQVGDPRAAFVISDILADPEARAPAFGRDGPLALPFECAAKTGTSKACRDNWTVGFTPGHVVGVWMGNFDGRPMRGVSGVTGAGPLFRDVMSFLEDRRRRRAGPRAPEPAFQAPAGLVRAACCPVSGQRPSPECPGRFEEWFYLGAVPSEPCGVHRRLGGRIQEVPPPPYRAWAAGAGRAVPASPRLTSGGAPAPAGAGRPGGLRLLSPEDGAVFRLDPVLRRDFQAVLLRAEVPEGIEAVEWRVDGRLLGRAGPPFTYPWPLRAGRHRIEVRLPGGGEASSSTVQVW